MVEQSLRNRWQSSVSCLINELCSSPSPSHSVATNIDNETQQALDVRSQSWLKKVAQLYAEPHGHITI